MKKLIIQISCLAILSSCAGMFDSKTYLQTRENFYTAYKNGNYQLALNELDKIKYLRAKYNKQLYLLEKGRLLQLIGENEKSAKLLNEADELAEGWTNLKLRPASGIMGISDLKSLKNTQFGFSQITFEPRFLKYNSEHYERMMINYTKAISYINMSKKDETLVEAKRLLLLSQQLGDLKVIESNNNTYVKDPFPELFAGMIFEWNSDYSNAFVSYENAYKCYSENGTEKVYGIKTPEQLQIDLLRLAYKLGYNDKLEYYQNLFGKKYEQKNNSSELILFIEDGTIPSRSEETKYFIFDTISKSSIDNTVNGSGNKLFLPTYQNHYQERYISVNTNNTSLRPTTIRNNNHVVMITLNSRVEKERTNLIASFDNTLKTNYQRMLAARKEQEMARARAYQTAQITTQPKPMPSAKSKTENSVINKPKVYDNNPSNKQQISDSYFSKQPSNSKAIQDKQNKQSTSVLEQKSETKTTMNADNKMTNQKNFGSNFSTSTSNNSYNNYSKPITNPHVDVRNWLSISAQVSYMRIPLQNEIDNNIIIKVAGKEINLNIKGTQGLQFKQVRIEN
jgi:hypothetical protein